MAEQLNKDGFIEKVFDYEKNKDWNYKGDIPCVIDFYADWCGPCKTLSPVIEELSKDYKGKVNFYKIDTSAEMELSSVFGIQSIPSLLFCPVEGKPQMAAGALPKETLVNIIDTELLTKAG